MANDAGCPTIAVRSMLGLGDRAKTDTQKQPESDSSMENERINREDPPKKIRDRKGMIRSTRYSMISNMQTLDVSIGSLLADRGKTSRLTDN